VRKELDFLSLLSLALSRSFPVGLICSEHTAFHLAMCICCSSPSHPSRSRSLGPPAARRPRRRRSALERRHLRLGVPRPDRLVVLDDLAHLGELVGREVDRGGGKVLDEVLGRLGLRGREGEKVRLVRSEGSVSLLFKAREESGGEEVPTARGKDENLAREGEEGGPREREWTHARDRDDVVALVDEPRERELRRLAALLLGDALELLRAGRAGDGVSLQLDAARGRGGEE